MLPIRFIEQSDFAEVVAIERRANAFIDPDFGVEQTHSWVKTHDDLLKLVRQRRDPAAMTFETRIFVVERLPAGEEDAPPLAGCFILELADDGYELMYLGVDPAVDRAEVLESVSAFLAEKVKRSPKRKKVEVHLIDRDEAWLRHDMMFWRGKGYRFTLDRGYYGEHDGWTGTWTAKEEKVTK